MIIDLELKKDPKTGMYSAGTDVVEVSDYHPTEEVKQRTVQVIREFQQANIARNKPYLEFNWTSFLQRLNLDRLSYNQYVESPSEDPAEAWKSRAFRPITRNKVNAIASYVTSQYIIPGVNAENDNNEEDRDAAQVMKDLMHWRNHQAGYERAFMHAVLDACTDPVSFLGTEYNENYRKVKELSDDGKSWTEKEVLDEEFSGFKDEVIPCDEIWIVDIYEPKLQRQPFIIRRKAIHYNTALAKYRDNKIFMEHVKPGIQFLWSDEQQLFYKVYDSSLRGELVEEIIYWNREADLRLVFCNGILISDVNEPNPRKDKKYPMVAMGYEFINSRFFYFKSVVFKLANDEEIVNTAYRMLADGTYMQIMPPAVVFGAEEIGRSVMAPGTITTIDNRDNPKAAFQTLQTNNNLNAGYQLLERVEASIAESSTSAMLSGSMPQTRTPAYTIATMQQNARTLLGLFEKMIGFAVKDFGELCLSDIIQHATVPEVQEIEGKDQLLRYKSFLIPNQTTNGKNVSRHISFDENLPTEPITQAEHLSMSQELAQTEVDRHKEKILLYKVNPTLFRKLKYSIYIEPEAITPSTDAMKKALLLEQYDRAIANPLVKKDAITRDLLLGAYDKTKGDTDKYMMSEAEQQQQQMAEAGQQPGQNTAEPGVSKELASALNVEQGPNNSPLMKVK